MLAASLLFSLAMPLAAPAADTPASPAPAPVLAPSPVGPASTLKLPSPELETLPNGLKVAWLLSDNLPVVDLALLVEAGYREDPAGKSGTAELLAQVLDRGNAGESAQQIAKSVERLGASRVVSADEESFTVGMHGLASDAETLLETLRKIALRPDFPEAEVKREHARALDRWRHLGDYGEALVSLAYSRILTAGTPYGRGSFLSEKEFAKIAREDLIQFHQRYFTPKNSILMVVGRVNRSKFRKKILEGFGREDAWKGERTAHSSASYADTRLLPANAKSPKLVVVHRPGLTQAQVKIGFRAPLFTSPDHYSLVVANALLGEFFNSRLNLAIRDQMGLTYGIGSRFSYSKDLATWSISSATRNDSVGLVVVKALEILRTLKDQKADAAFATEVTMAKEYLVGGFPLGTSTLGAVASRWLAGYIFGLGPDYLNEFIPKISAIQPAEVARAAAQHVKLDDLVIVVAGDAAAIEKSLRAAKLTPKRVEAKDLM